MTVRFVKRNVYFLSFLGLLALASCESNDSELTLNDTLTTEEVQNVVLADDYSSDVEDVIEDDAVVTEVAGRGHTPPSNHPDCLIRTVEETTNGKIVTLDFGDGCEGRRGRIFAGKIIIEYTRVDGTFSKVVSFEGFSVNDNGIEGSVSVSKMQENSNGNPERSYAVDITINLSTGETITKKGEKVKEMIEGADTDTRGDDVFLITGFWESVNKYGEVFKATITTPLRREYACKFIVSGVVEITKGGNDYTLDFGDGSCDNKATITDADGNTREITLRERRRR
ncbi:hypothetical protein [Tenacibaculum xiamenense]|uniref:hypothetical protein n=1 Tax=Tenacibaculum xiamenense TaxID=1261553 RepID=UPI003894EDE3